MIPDGSGAELRYIEVQNGSADPQSARRLTYKPDSRAMVSTSIGTGITRPAMTCGGSTGTSPPEAATPSCGRCTPSASWIW